MTLRQTAALSISARARALLVTLLALSAVARADDEPQKVSDPMTQPTTAASLAAEVRRALDGADQDLHRMPFFVRPIARRKFKARTGLSYDAWREKLDAIHPTDSPADVRARWPDAEAALERLADDFRGAPERARGGMGDNEEVLREITESSKARAASTEGLLAWLRG